MFSVECWQCNVRPCHRFIFSHQMYSEHGAATLHSESLCELHWRSSRLFKLLYVADARSVHFRHVWTNRALVLQTETCVCVWESPECWMMRWSRLFCSASPCLSHTLSVAMGRVFLAERSVCCVWCLLWVQSKYGRPLGNSLQGTIQKLLASQTQQNTGSDKMTHCFPCAQVWRRDGEVHAVNELHLEHLR